jgi:hypothetical protein
MDWWWPRIDWFEIAARLDQFFNRNVIKLREITITCVRVVKLKVEIITYCTFVLSIILHIDHVYYLNVPVHIDRMTFKLFWVKSVRNKIRIITDFTIYSLKVVFNKTMIIIWWYQNDINKFSKLRTMISFPHTVDWPSWFWMFYFIFVIVEIPLLLSDKSRKHALSYPNMWSSMGQVWPQRQYWCMGIQ